MTGWWYRASTEQRLAQIDGCIELGMTAAQCALNCGCFSEIDGWKRAGTVIHSFAAYYGRSFPMTEDKEVGRRKKLRRLIRRRLDLRDARQSYLAGEPVDFWSAT
jgi:hypothetical protein